MVVNAMPDQAACVASWSADAVIGPVAMPNPDARRTQPS